MPAPARNLSPEGARAEITRFADALSTRRSIRSFSSQPIDMSLVETALRIASSAPSGANVQPWHFVVVTDPAIKAKIRAAAEEEEKAFYDSKASKEWLAALEPLGTDWRKPFLETAPALIVVFEVHHSETTPRPYYVKESVGIAVGFLIAALHLAGLVTLTHTPSPMRFLNEILGRPKHERPFVLLPVGIQAADAEVPDIHKKELEEVTSWLPSPGSLGQRRADELL
ncbi:MAG: nitroreductase family protein [Actinobacteria bacterium]|nr:nitroreductase family protein [Actinomycetota bacterium]